MKADKLAKELLNYEDEDGYNDVFVRDDKLLVRSKNSDNNKVILEGRNYSSNQSSIRKDVFDKLLERAIYYGSGAANTKRDLHNFSAEVIELIEGSSE